MISLQNISKSFTYKGKVSKALKDINLEVKQGEIFAIIGGSGAGKSTLLRCINLLEKPDCGSITFEGTNLTALPEHHLRSERKKIAMIFQHFNLINNKTVLENIALPLRLLGEKDVKTRALEQLKLVELSDKAHSYPSQLSGGQKQRVAIARALISNPRLLLCDEATSALDPKTTKEVLALIKKINQTLGITVILISHEMEVVRQICNRFAIIEAGMIQQVASINEVLASHPVHHPLVDGLVPQLPDYLKNSLCSTPQSGHYPLCQIMFYGDVSQEAIISELSKSTNLKLNILLANIDVIGEQTFGILILQIKGSEDEFQQALAYFKQKNLTVEILGYVK